mmetsp:Transcript_55137/g.102103  ORF Transcript_55137/g.102103 Transcript_55137/m.102103 type:complete len:237 (-) Transcript_55137:1392-2102(-)
MCWMQSFAECDTRTLRELYAAILKFLSVASGRAVAWSSCCTRTVKYSDRGPVGGIIMAGTIVHWGCASANTWMTQHTFTATRGTSLSRSASSGVNTWIGTMDGWNCAMRPSVHANVSRTATLLSLRACTISCWKLCSTRGRIFSLVGPSMMDPYARIAASLYFQSWCPKFCCTKPSTTSTQASPLTWATRPRHVPAAIAIFWVLSSSSSLCCLVRHSVSKGTKKGKAWLMRLRLRR